MRGDMPLLLMPVAAVLRARCSYRWCRRCRRTWLALHSPRRSVVRNAPTVPVRRREGTPVEPPAAPAVATPAAPAPGVARPAPTLSGSWRAERGSLAWALRLSEDPQGNVAGSGTLSGDGRSFALMVSGRVAGNQVDLEVECAGSQMFFEGQVAAASVVSGTLRLGESSRSLVFEQYSERWMPAVA